MKTLRISLLVLCTFLLAAGCVSTSKFDTAISDVTTRVDGIQTTVEEQGEAIEELGEKDQELASDISKVDAKAAEANAAAADAKSTAVDAMKTARGKVVWQVTLTNSDVSFGVDKTDLSDAGKAALNELVTRVKSMDRAVFIEIQGHTDSTGAEAYNEKLGMKRAQSVHRYLYEAGIPLHMLEAVSYGETKPVADNGTPEGRAANRRVEVLVLE